MNSSANIETSNMLPASLVFLFTALTALAQTVPPPANPPYDPNDPEGLVAYPNKSGRYVWKRKGPWTAAPLTSRPGFPAVAPPALQAMNQTLNQLSALLRATPEGSSLLGWFMKEPRSYYLANPYDLPAPLSPSALPVQFEAGFYPFYLADDLRNGKYVQVTSGETEGIYFVFNRLPGPQRQPIIAQEKNGDRAPIPFFTRPNSRPAFAGYPVLDGQELLITRPGRDPYAPVPYPRALRAALPEFEKDKATAEQRLASLKATEAETLAPAYEQAMRDHLEKYSGALRSTDPKKYAGRLQSMERELLYNRDKARQDANPQRDDNGNWYWHPLDALADAQQRLANLTPAESATPACFLPAPQEQGRYALRGRILPLANSPDCQPLVMQNFSYFDPKLPRHAPPNPRGQPIRPLLRPPRRPTRPPPPPRPIPRPTPRLLPPRPHLAGPRLETGRRPPRPLMHHLALPRHVIHQ
jgi:hypothetical protein